MGEWRKGLTRRGFLKLGALVLAASQLRGENKRVKPGNFDARFGLVTEGERVPFAPVASLAERFNRISAYFNYRPEITTATIGRWTEIAMAYFRLTGVTDGDVKLPERIEFRVLDSEGDRGLSNCQTEALLDIDFIDPKASLFRSPRFVPTLFHELFHIQQGVLCETLARDIIESTAQVVSWTVLAAVAIRERGNSWGREAAYALVLEMRKVATNIAFLETLRNGSNQKVFMDLLWQIYGFSAQAVLNKAMKECMENPQKSLQALARYSEKPLALVAKAHLMTGGLVTGLPLNQSETYYVGGGSPYIFDGSMPFDINPLVYFLEHAGSIIEGYA